MKTAYCTGAGIQASLLPGAGEVRSSGAAILSPAVHLLPPDPADSLPLPPRTPRLTAPECSPRLPSPGAAATRVPRARRPLPHPADPLWPRTRTCGGPGRRLRGSRAPRQAVHAQRRRVNSPGRAPLARRPPRPLLRAPRPYLVAEFEHCHSSVPARAHIQLSAPQMSTPGARRNGRNGPGKRQEPGSLR